MKNSIYFVVLFINSILLIHCDRSAEEKKDTYQPVYQINRKPLRQNPYIELPLGSIKPGGWLKEMLLRQKTGSTGHLDELYPLVMGEDNGWLGGDGDQWERGPYWINGLITLAYTLDDQELIDKTTPWIEWMLNSQKPNGYFGPDTDYENLPGVQRNNAADWWPRMVVLKILKQYYSATGDEKVIELMTNYFKYQLETLPEKPLDNWTFWAKYRGGDNLMIVYWLYNITGDEFLLDLAEILHTQTFNYTHKFTKTDMIPTLQNIHAVNLVQGIKEPAIYYQHHPDKIYIESIKKVLWDIRKFSGQPQGLFGGDEALRNSDPTHGVELCSVVELMFSLENILAITGEVQFADHLEKVAYNALPTQITDDFMNRQYFQQANQVMITKHYRNFSVNHSGTDVCFGLLTGYPCCTANMHQGWPYFTQNLWYATPEGGLAALVYAPSSVTAKVKGDIEVKIREETHYPFEDHIRFIVEIPDQESAKFPLELRIPGWCKQAEIRINDEITDQHKGNQMVKMERAWKNGDVIDLELPVEIKRKAWHERSVSIERGPLSFVLRIEEKWEKKTNDHFTEHYGDYYYEVTPTDPWNYGLIDIPEEQLNDAYEIIWKEEISEFPWNLENAPIAIKAPAKKMPLWTLYNESAGPLPYSIQHGQVTAAEEEIVTLIPYGCSTLRIAEFPLIGDYSIMK